LKAFTHTASLVTNEAATTPSPVQVCMHVRGTARTDVRVMREATVLAEAGFSVSIIDIEHDTTRLAEEDLAKIHVQHILRPGWFILPRFKLWRLVRILQKLIVSTFRLVRMPTDIYHAHDVNALLPCYIAAQLRRKLLVFDAHEMPLHELEDMRPRWAHALITQLFAIIVRRCAGVSTVSPPIIAEMCSRYHLTDVSLIRNTLSFQEVPRSERLRQHLGLASNTRIVLYAGNFQPNRTLDKLVRAARFLERDIVIVLMGRNVGSTQAELEALVAREGTADRVKIIPPVPYEELLTWTSSADIGAIVSAPDHSINARVQFPNKLFEYLMVGLPVIASQLPAIAEIIEAYDVGRLLPSLEPAAIGAEINAMLADRAGLERMRRNALEASQRDLNWQKESQLLLRLYHNVLLKQHKGRRGLKTLPQPGAVRVLEGEPGAHSLRS
jgi:glycosyltransferase involved in cell wall biosynthesis